MHKILQKAVKYKQSGRLEEAEHCFRKVAEVSPENADVYNEWAVVLHGLNRYQDAAQAFRRVTELRPGHAPAFYNLGIGLRAAGLVEQAVSAYKKSIALDASNAPAYTSLGNAFSDLQQFDKAIDAFEGVLRLSANDSGVLVSLGRMYQSAGRFHDAVSACRKVLASTPDNQAVRYRLGLCLHDMGKMQESVRELKQLVRIAPQSAGAHFALAMALVGFGDNFGAINAYECSAGLEPGALVLTRLGGLYRGQDRVDEAEKAYRKAIEYDSAYVDAYAQLALLLEQLSKEDDLPPVLRHGLKLAADEPSLNLVAAMLDRRHGRFKDAVERLEKLLTTDTDRVRSAMELPDYSLNNVPAIFREGREQGYIKPSVFYELGLSYDRLENIEEAFRCFSQGNYLKSETQAARRFNKNVYLKEIKDLRALVSAEQRVSVHGLNTPVSTPVFLVGFPRSGTTLLDQVLDSHADIQVMEEPPTLHAVQARLHMLPGGFPGALKDLNDAQVEALRGVYFESVNSLLDRQPGSVLVDKMPLNITKISLIWKLFPGAKFILAVRHPCDVCLSCFMQHFKPNEAMNNFYTLEDAALLYDRTMASWVHCSDMLSLPCHIVRYEDLLEGFERTARGILNFLGLEWNDVMLEYAQHARARGAINTPSYHQVTQPLYKHARYRWKRYAEQMAGVLPELEPYIEMFGYNQPNTAERIQS